MRQTSRQHGWSCRRVAAAGVAFLPLGSLVSSFELTGSTDAVEGCTVNSSSVQGRSLAHSSLGVRVFPLLPEETCTALIAAAEDVASRSGGWSTDRHGKYATTDLEVRSYPSLWALVEPYLTAAAAGSLASLADTSEEVTFHDVFIVRYDERGQRSLDTHADGSRVTLQVTLNAPSSSSGSGFTGGGTYFEQLQCRVQPGVGEALAFPGDLRHSGLEIYSGRRYVLVGFSKHVTASEEEQENLHLTFGQGYNVSLSDETDEQPCIKDGGSGPAVRAHVSWWGCRQDSFSLNVRSKDRSGQSSLSLLWLQQQAADCEATERSVWQQTLQFAEGSWVTELADGSATRARFRLVQLEAMPKKGLGLGTLTMRGQRMVCHLPVRV
ncbi:unnamed protein product [Polarella glacialis]|uniref:Fe2OG dioxygenase domain-containing protein n=1 Tax=Polarella glacialis TaxID=89957 RepID=A0A813K044_POLGL|nr:unnamed protein product [Polarella glacialis]